MTPAERSALAALRFDVAPTPEDIWQPSPFDVPELHEPIVREIFDGMKEARRASDASPIGVIVEGRAGSGKTHMLGAVRESIQREDGGYFFLVRLISGRTFWENTAVGMLEGLTQKTGPWGMQLTTFLRRLTASLGIDAGVRDIVAGHGLVTKTDLDTFVRAIRTHVGLGSLQYLDTARALVLLGSADYAAQDVGLAHLVSVPGEPAERAAWGLTPAVRKPQEIVQDISRLLALTKVPTVIAVDQLDTMFAQTASFSVLGDGIGEEDAVAASQVADGLLTLRDTTLRTLTVVSILPDALELLKKYASAPVLDRFRQTVVPDHIPTAEIGQKIVARRFLARFKENHFSPEYDTWPIKPEAFRDAVKFSPRGLLRRIDKHVTYCLAKGEVIELVDLNEPAVVTSCPPPETLEEALVALDRQFAIVFATADITGALDHTTEDAELPALLGAGLKAWIDERAGNGAVYKHDPLPSTKPALHGRLVEVLNETTENEAHWAFRAIASPHAVAVISRIKAACNMAGLDVRVPQRQLVLLRNTPWPTGPRTTEIVQAFRAAGGVERAVGVEDLKVFAALREMYASPDPDLRRWLAERQPATKTALLGDLLGDRQPTGPRQSETPDETAESAADDAAPAVVGPSIGLGRTADGATPFEVNLESLRRHTVIFAGSGSGKTVLIRRLVEECARAGVSSIVLDPNNDLARLGDAWPQSPSGWAEGDAARARDYLDNTEVVVWTPRVSGGKPLTFQPLPDFTPVLSSPDEFNAAIDAAVAALAPRAKVDGKTKLAEQGRAVLKEALLWYARNGRTGLRGFADLLSELPDDLSQFAKGKKLAHDAGETLKAAMVNDALFGGEGTAVDPGELLTPTSGKRARVSVISFVGLTSDEQKQSFVNQLQMALFAWIKRNPAGDRPLGGLFIMDEAQTLAPSTGNTPCTASSIALASQARKYGLGLVFATQAPKGLHNQISGNATTQFFGLLNAPAQIDAARDLAQAKGGRLPDIGLLNSGQFYAAGEGFSFIKVNTPLCLTHHPKAPLSPEEVIARAAAS
jgi:Helicase HerA, central domain